MIYLPLSKFVDSGEVAVAPGAAILAEGQALTRQAGSTSAGVGPALGNATEVFCGFAVAGVSAAPFAEGYDNKVETFVVGATGIVTLAKTPVAGQLVAFDNTAGAVDATAVVVGQTVTSLTVGNTVTITYKYAMTATEARARLGDVQPGGYAGAVVGQVGAAKRGVIYTSEFDAAIDWAAATAIKLKANGQLTVGGAGVTIDAHVVSVPTADRPFLGIEFTS